MKMPPELEKSIKTALALFMEEPEAERFMNLEYATSIVKQWQLQQPPWQSLFSLGVHVAEVYACQDKDVQKKLLQELVGQTLEPVDSLFQSILPKPGEKPLESEQARLLFHTRFALGFLLLAGADTKRSKAILHDMAATKVSVRGHSYYGEGPGILGCTDDIKQGKLQAAIHLLPEYVRQKDYYEILYLITEAVTCTPWATSILYIIPAILDACAAEYESRDYDGAAGLEWLHLFVEAGELLSLYEEYDSVGSAPNECKVESAPYMAWKIGLIAGRFAARYYDDPFGKFQDFDSTIGEEEYQSERGEEKTRHTVMAILALLREYGPARDWQKVRDQCLQIWGLSDSYSGMPLSDIGPCHDLYWAMRIGFADALLKYPASLADTGEIDNALGSKVWRQIDDILKARPPGRVSLSREEVLRLVDSEESDVLEFKSSVRWGYKEGRLVDYLGAEVVRTVAAFLNKRHGGRLIVGVSDLHKILGIDNDYKDLPGGRDQYQRFLIDKLNSSIVPLSKLVCAHYVSITFYKVGNQELCLLDVERSDEPVYVRENGIEIFDVRSGNSSPKLNTREAVDYIRLNFPGRSSQT